MFAKSALAALSIFALASTEVVAKPIEARSTAAMSKRSSFPSFDNYDGFSSMSNFDNFFGDDNFSGSLNEQIIVTEETEIICESIDINYVQQRLIIMAEIVKEIILEQICEVEVQEIVIEQFVSYFSSFSESIIHESSFSASFDISIVSLYEQVFESDGSLSNYDLGFLGSSVGQNSVVVGGNNWNDNSSPISVGNAKSLADQAINCEECS